VYKITRNVNHSRRDGEKKRRRQRADSADVVLKKKASATIKTPKTATLARTLQVFKPNSFEKKQRENNKGLDRDNSRSYL
jgi:hypothetical protein